MRRSYRTANCNNRQLTLVEACTLPHALALDAVHYCHDLSRIDTSSVFVFTEWSLYFQMLQLSMKRIFDHPRIFFDVNHTGHLP